MARTARTEPELAVIRDRILDAAALMFSRKGIVGVSMADLAKEAGYSTASLYNYFPGKDALVRALLARGFARCLAVVEQPMPLDLPAEGRLEFILLGLLGNVQEHFWLMTFLLFRDRLPEPMERNDDTYRFLALYDDLFAVISVEVARLEWLPRTLVPRLTHHFMGMVRTEAIVWFHSVEPASLVQLAHELITLWLAGAHALTESAVNAKTRSCDS